ncbi:hypothetical protein CH063_08078 [Colletotrichum higginsianum]|uniref:Uncharacterized protein n=2 Tax=Colletotrichum higginsianum TaxID=80884 RepID=H1V8H9_COLHI|nr:hypothetical protein CH63R_08341 [Colletotrichum higginsianum IMI 349063]OBR09576.1 hypothetical protein CH63R_08341 [Colletotrichum higginsianum IMI 349063]TIC95853.1 hypothetical protein CH35J_007844 [Colletotrichum higginsianum]GJC96350.1 hypothetical protein ColKHC_05176 [Colletotrichum higginsianum]CCF36532.1 hypothetical protein CH063_08078 [Colletotrichum higginsianum]
MAYHGQTALNLFADEINGELRDRALRGAIEGKIRHFFDCVDKKNWPGVQEHLRPDVKLLLRLRGPGDIYRNQHYVVEQLKREVASGQTTVHKLLLVDRGRVTCYAATFWMARVKAEQTPYFFESHQVFVIDLDDRHQIKRIDIRDNTDDVMQHDGDKDKMEIAIEETKTDAMHLIDRI